ncbi:MAG: hypothetical protein ACYDHZ_00700 [Dehalococcoidia bacterium]
MNKLPGIVIDGSAGLVTTTTGNDLLHTLSTARTAIIRKIMWYNNTGAVVTLRIGTVDNQAIPVFVPMLPTIAAINGLHDNLMAAEIPDVEFAPNRGALAAGRSGNIYVVGSAAGVLIVISVEEWGR